MAAPLAWWLQQYRDLDGNPASLGKLIFTQTGTSTPVAVFQDIDRTVEWPDPLQLDASGNVPGVIYPPQTPYLDVLLTDVNDVTIAGPYGPIPPLEPEAAPPPICVAPAITVQPADQNVSTGDPATVSVTATGTATLTYQWYLGSSGDTSDPILGAVASSYTTLDLAAGVYTGWVRIANDCGSVDSLTVTVTAS